MKKINHFKPNVIPDHEMAERQWKWNYLRRMKKLLKGNRKSFVEAGWGINLFTRGGNKNATRV